MLGTFEIIIIAVIIMTSIAGYILYCYNESKLDKLKDEFINDIQIGDRYISYVQSNKHDIYEKMPCEIYVDILNIKYDKDGNIYVKVRWYNDDVNTISAETLYKDFYKE